MKLDWSQVAGGFSAPYNESTFDVAEVIAWVAVSLLAWVPVESAIVKPERLSADDPSGWMRKHAEWAVECVKQEAPVRRYYERTLKETDQKTVMSRLQVLLPAVTPAARWCIAIWNKRARFLRQLPDMSKPL